MDSQSDKLRKYLECSICLSTYVDPQQLSCRHQFCKICLDNIVVFNDDGSAVIDCPTRCGKRTHLKKNQTTKDLGTTYDFKGILDIVSADASSNEIQNGEISEPSCKFVIGCKGKITKYCCGRVMCSACSIMHDGMNVGHSPNGFLLFDKDSDPQFKIVCEKHATSCTNYCLNDKKFLCMYCINRNHKGHEMVSMEDRVSQIRAAVTKDVELNNNIKEMLISTKNKISNTRKQLEEVLIQRKVYCLTKYHELLNQEEEKIKAEFEQLTKANIERYPDIKHSEYHYDILCKDDVELLTGEDCKSLIKSELDSSPVQNQTIRLTDIALHGYLSPLGKLREEKCNIPASRVKEIQAEGTFKGVIPKVKNSEEILKKLFNNIKLLPQPQESTAVASESKKLTGGFIPTVWVNFVQLKQNDMLREVIHKYPVVLSLKDKSLRNYSLVQLAVLHDNFDILETILNHDEKQSDVKTNLGESLLDLALVNNSTVCFDWLLQKFPKFLNMQDWSGQTPLHKAAARGELDKLMKLMINNAVLLIKDESGYDALHHAAVNNQGECLNALHSFLNKERKGINNVDEPPENDDEKDKRLFDGFLPTAVGFLPLQRNDDLKDLIKNRPVILTMKERSERNYFLVQLVVLHDNFDILETILNHDEKQSDVKTDLGESLLDLALIHNSTVCFDWLLQKFPKFLNMQDCSGQTTLHKAAACGALQKLMKLLTNNAVILIKDESGYDALHHAAVNNQRECLNALHSFLNKDRRRINEEEDCKPLKKKKKI